MNMNMKTNSFSHNTVNDVSLTEEDKNTILK